jgi:hypothetical protein
MHSPPPPPVGIFALCSATHGLQPISHLRLCLFMLFSPFVTRAAGEQAIIVKQGANTCNQPAPPPKPAAFVPDGWPQRFAAGNLLNSTLADKSAQVGNGYLAFFVGGGTECVAGLFNGRLSYPLRTTSHRPNIPSGLTSVFVSSIGGLATDKSSVPAAIDLEASAYLQEYVCGFALLRFISLFLNAAAAHVRVRAELSAICCVCTCVCVCVCVCVCACVRACARSVSCEDS